ncbi:hypothetical protein LTR49_024833 [Elasticomyces elasticus]|nr:hypothetical protein LTR49_024833 [Elasticomyces elasticus]
MSSDKLSIADSRVQHCFAVLNGQSYHYLLGTPSKSPRATIFLIHGWPDFSFGWRYQIPVLLSLNLQVVVPDMMGYGLTASPHALKFYTMKRAAQDMVALAKQLKALQIILLGHDWGGTVVYRIALWYPEIVIAVLSVCTPYARPNKTCTPIEDLVKKLPNFAYQKQLASGEVEKRIRSTQEIRDLLNAMYEGVAQGARAGFVSEQGVLFTNLHGLKRTHLLTEEELDYYAGAYSRNDLRGTLNWYRARQLNHTDEQEMANVKGLKITQPALFISARRDKSLPHSMSRGMEQHFNTLKRAEVDAGHWALWQVPDEFNSII